MSDSLDALYRELNGSRVAETRFGRFHYNYLQELDRRDGPAIEYASGTRIWFLRGVRHRIGGAAVEHHDGRQEWFIYGRRYTKESHYIARCKQLGLHNE